jgi:hypothetical protein
MDRAYHLREGDRDLTPVFLKPFKLGARAD